MTDWREFLKPTIGKIILFSLFFIFSSVLLIPFLSILLGGAGGESESYGFPIFFLDHFYGRTPDNGFYSDWQIHYVSLIIDLLFWYVITCAIFLLFRKKEAKNSRPAGLRSHNRA